MPERSSVCYSVQASGYKKQLTMPPIRTETERYGEKIKIKSPNIKGNIKQKIEKWNGMLHLYH